MATKITFLGGEKEVTRGKDICDCQWFTGKIGGNDHALFFKMTDRIIGFTANGEFGLWGEDAPIKNYKPVDVEIKVL